ncbi:MAG: DUF177 domain-containing protein [Candidatus Omnitrophica bacterium]|nr:DUF177 domain-containing protein [Candidatus Omnitrophota bacterium]
MKIDTRQIPDEGLTLTEEFSSAELDLDTEIIKFCGAIKAKAVISKSYDAIGVKLSLNAPMLMSCSRCLQELNTGFSRQIELHYAVDKLEPIIDLDPDIREEIILSYPINPLCSDACKGLCPRCGCNLNEGGCNCGST